MNKDGVSDFSALMKAVHKKSNAIAFVAFDLLHLDGIDLRKGPRTRRRELLSELVPDDSAIQTRIILSRRAKKSSRPSSSSGWKAWSLNGRYLWGSSKFWPCDRHELLAER